MAFSTGMLVSAAWQVVLQTLANSVSGQSVAAPNIERLSHDYCITHKHKDATFLLQSVLDAIVDHAIPTTAAFRYETNNMELHLSMLKRTLAPTQTLVHSFRVVEDIDSILGLCEKLINMIFNLIAYDTNETMRR
ncbi:MAG: hypothetical protein BYD32DRAFT_458200 [Podila humilis]|nr:MAG: hypothetical protein BYD32DRAFT_458200 [Podila humilis]